MLTIKLPVPNDQVGVLIPEKAISTFIADHQSMPIIRP